MPVRKGLPEAYIQLNAYESRVKLRSLNFQIGDELTTTDSGFNGHDLATVSLKAGMEKSFSRIIGRWR